MEKETGQISSVILEILPHLSDFGFLAFGLMGVFFGWRALRQRNDEIKEKYFDRRYELYCSVDDAIKLALNPIRTVEHEWWKPLIEARRKSRFLVGPRAQASIERMHDLSIDYLSALEENNVAERAPKAMAARKALEAEFLVFRAHMETYLTVA